MKPMTLGEWFKLVYMAQTGGQVDERLTPIAPEEFDLIMAYANEVAVRFERNKADNERDKE